MNNNIYLKLVELRVKKNFTFNKALLYARNNFDLAGEKLTVFQLIKLGYEFSSRPTDPNKKYSLEILAENAAYGAGMYDKDCRMVEQEEEFSDWQSISYEGNSYLVMK